MQKEDQKQKGSSSPLSTNFLMYQKVKLDRQSFPNRNTMRNQDAYYDTLAYQYFQLGNDYQKQKQFDLSINFFQNAIKYRYYTPEIHNNIGVLYVLKKEYQLAQKSFKQSLQIKPDQTFPKINLANLKFKQEEFLAGIEIFLELMSTNQDKRILNHFHKILINENIFYRFFKKYFACAHNKIGRQKLQSITNKLLKGCNKVVPITNCFSAQITPLSPRQIQKILEVFQYTRIQYSRQKISISHSKQAKATINQSKLSLIYQNLQDQKMRNIVSLLSMYIFMDEEKADFCLYFYSMINKFNNRDVYQEYLKMYLNYVDFKKENSMLYLKSQYDYQDQALKKSQYDYQGQELKERKKIIQSIQRFFFRQKLPMYRLHELQTYQQFQIPCQRSLELLARTLEQLPNYQHCAAYYFSLYCQQSQQPQQFDNYLIQASFLEYFWSKTGQSQVFDYSKSLAVFQKAIKSENCSRKQQLEIAKHRTFMTFSNYEYEKAIQLCKQYIKQFPQQEYLFYQYLGTIYLTAGRPNEALITLNNAIAINPKFAQAWFQKYSIHFQLKQYNQALKCLQKSIELNPAQLKYYLQLGQFYLLKSQFTSAIDDFICNLEKQFTSSIHFKIKANIAIFRLATLRFHLSYNFFRVSLEEASKETDTNNCQDLLFLYFVNKISWLFSFYFVEKCHGYMIEAGLYLIIFLNSPFLEVKYHKKSIQFDQQILKRICYNINGQLGISFDYMLNIIKHFSDEHKAIICQYIFKSAFNDDSRVQALQFYELLIQKYPSMQENLQTFNLIGKIKQNKLAQIKNIFDFVLKGKYSTAVEYFSIKTQLIQLIQFIRRYQLVKKEGLIESMFSLILLDFQTPFEKSQLTPTFSEFYNFVIIQIKEICRITLNSLKEHLLPRDKINLQKIKKLLTQIATKDKKQSQKPQNQIELKNIDLGQEKASVFSSNQSLINFKKIAIQFKQQILILQIVLITYGQLYFIFYKNAFLESQFTKICQKFLREKNIDAFYRKLRNFIYQDFHEQSSQRSSFNPGHLSQDFLFFNDKNQMLDIDDVQEKSKRGTMTSYQRNILFIQTDRAIKHYLLQNIGHLIKKEDNQSQYMMEMTNIHAKKKYFLFAVSLINELEDMDIILMDLSQNQVIQNNGGYYLSKVQKLFMLKSPESCNQEEKLACRLNYNTIQYWLSLLSLNRQIPLQSSYQKTFSPPFLLILGSVHGDKSIAPQNKAAEFLKRLKQQKHKHHLSILQRIYKKLFDLQNLSKDDKPAFFVIKLLFSGKISYKPFRNKFQKLCQKNAQSIQTNLDQTKRKIENGEFLKIVEPLSKLKLNEDTKLRYKNDI